MKEWPIKDVARAAGLTSRTLRHYEAIGLLQPGRVASNGYRFYGQVELARLYRILSLRELGLPLATIRTVLEDDEPLAEIIQSHLLGLEEQRDRVIQQITVVQQTLHTIKKGQEMNIEEIFAGVDHSQYEGEVRQRWGDAAWERGAKRRQAMSQAQRELDDARSLAVNSALRAAAESGAAPESEHFQELVAEHHAWVTEQWGGRTPEHDAYLGLAELYVTDERFAATYGGQANAKIIRAAIQAWAEVSLA